LIYFRLNTKADDGNMANATGDEDIEGDDGDTMDAIIITSNK
jgi:hypothetical protein